MNSIRIVTYNSAKLYHTRENPTRDIHKTIIKSHSNVFNRTGIRKFNINQPASAEPPCPPNPPSIQLSARCQKQNCVNLKYYYNAYSRAWRRTTCRARLAKKAKRKLLRTNRKRIAVQRPSRTLLDRLPSAVIAASAATGFALRGPPQIRDSHSRNAVLAFHRSTSSK